LPPLFEQEKTVEILSSVDLAIKKVDEAITQAERLKRGLMQTLLTRGIGRKEFKETEIGKIPKTWQVVKLREVVLEAKSGFASGKRDENGIFQLRMDSIETEGWINPEAGVKVPIPSDVEEYLLKPGDILFNNTNSVDLIGKTAIFRGELPKCVFSNHLTRIRVNPEKVIPEWILFVLIRKWQIGFFKTICHRHVHQAGINNNDLLNIKIPFPEISEQQKIAEILSSVDNILHFKRQKKEKLVRMRRRLMDLLLTGRVRVSL
jgi:type I restriction enzyme S subunit